MPNGYWFNCFLRTRMFVKPTTLKKTGTAVILMHLNSDATIISSSRNPTSIIDKCLAIG